MWETITDIPSYHLLFYFIGVVISVGVHLRAQPTHNRPDLVRVLSMYTIGITGFSGIMGFFAHTLFADAVAASIGWPAGSPFQTEVAGANLAIGLIGFLGFWFRSFWLPYIIAKTAFLWTAAATHIIDLVEHNNFAPNNAGPTLWWDIFLPVCLIALYWGQRTSTLPLPEG